MGEAKQIVVRPVSAAEANAVVRRYHYSGKIVSYSQLHLGVFLGGRLEGAMQFGSSIDKRRMAGLVEGSNINQFLELNRMAFSPSLPRNSESRALSIAVRMLRTHAKGVKWIVTFADGTQCGDGTIYRAAGFTLVQVKRNTTLRRLDNGTVISDRALNDRTVNGKYASAIVKTEPLAGFQLKYVKFLDPTWEHRLTVEPLPYSEIDRLGAGMYRGNRK